MRHGSATTAGEMATRPRPIKGRLLHPAQRRIHE
jgi:hypothetical protein